LEDYAEASSAPLVALALEALGAATPQTLAAAAPAGIAYALTGLLRAISSHARTGRLWIPDDIATETGLAARALRHGLPRRALPALLPARVADLALKRL